MYLQASSLGQSRHRRGCFLSFSRRDEQAHCLAGVSGTDLWELSKAWSSCHLSCTLTLLGTKKPSFSLIKRDFGRDTRAAWSHVAEILNFK